MAERRTVPKFGSFKPKAEPDPAQTSASSPRKPTFSNIVDAEVETRNRERGRDSGRRTHHSSHHESRHRKHKSQPKSQSPERPYRTERDVHKSSTAKDLSTEIFTVDLKGDLNNLIYGSNHRYDVPAYRRIGAGGVMGAFSDMKIDRDLGEGKSIILTSKRAFKPMYRERYVFSKIEKEKPRLFRIKPQVVETLAEVNYISLQTKRDKKSLRQDEQLTSESDSEQNYRSVHGRAKAKEGPVDDDLEYATESDLSGTEAKRVIHVDTSLSEMSVKLARNVEKNPGDIKAWLALIAHQDVLLQSGARRVTSAEIQSTADIKLHMYEKALEQATTLSDRERLLLGIMEEGSKVWDNKTQCSRWEQISSDYIDSLFLWERYLDFKQSDFSTFRYEEVKSVFFERLKLLLLSIDTEDSSKRLGLYKQVIYVLLRLTVYMRTSGYSELAVATWQGLIEFNFFAPETPAQLSEKRNLFQAFWESEVPRFGESGALGWTKYVDNADSSNPPEPLVDEVSNDIDAKTIFKDWVISEKVRSLTSQVAARTMDEVAEDDPFRVILFSDIQESMISFPGSKEMYTCLANAFLAFCGFQVTSQNDFQTQRIWLNDPFIGGDSLDLDIESIAPKSKMSTFDPDSVSQPPITLVLTTCVPNFVPSFETMYGSSWFVSLQPWQKQESKAVSYVWVRTALAQLSQVYLESSFLEIFLAFEWRNESATIKKISKALLKRHPSNVRLYNAYGMIEWAKGNKQLAAGVFGAALKMGEALSEDDQRDLIYVWKSWIWTTLDDGDYATALRLLLSISDGVFNSTVECSPATLLKTKQHLTSSRDHALYKSDYDHATALCECLALLEYLTSSRSTEAQTSTQGDIVTGMLVFTAFSHTLGQRGLSKTPVNEMLLQSAARLLYHHAGQGPFRPAILREHLTSFLSLFPHNSIFLSLYTYNESRLRIENRVRNLFQNTILSSENDCMTSRLFAIHYELAHGNIHSVHSAFENAISSPACRSSISLWRSYILFCVQTPRFQSQAKEIWYRALRACPWAKGLYVVGFETLDGVSFDEFKGTWRVMGEKDLRVHVDLEDLFDEIGEKEKQGKTRTHAGKLGFK